MKVLFLVSHLSGGGAERTVAYLSGYLARNGVDTCVLSVSDKKFYELDERVKYASLHIANEEKNIVDRWFKAVRRTVLINRFIAREQPDVVFCMLYRMAKYLTLTKNRSYKLIVSERNNPAVVKAKKDVDLRRRIFSACNGIVFQTLRAQNYFPEEFRRKGAVIPNAVGNEQVYRISPVSDRAQKICAVGRLCRQKNYPLLIRAFKRVLKKHPAYVLEIYGNGPDLPALTELAGSLGISDRVRFCGMNPNVVQKIADAACYVLCSLYEGMPNALMEAMAAGVPCVAVDCPNGPAELIVDGENGILIPCGEEDALVGAILKMIEDKQFAERCGLRAREILRTHGLETNAQQYLEFINDVVRENRT